MNIPYLVFLVLFSVAFWWLFPLVYFSGETDPERAGFEDWYDDLV